MSTRPGSRERRENAKIFALMKFPFTTESHTDRCIAMGGENVAGCCAGCFRFPIVDVSGWHHTRVWLECGGTWFGQLPPISLGIELAAMTLYIHDDDPFSRPVHNFQP